jgi:hypothetical protein
VGYLIDAGMSASDKDLPVMEQVLFSIFEY